jgi:hypothetical protein
MGHDKEGTAGFEWYVPGAELFAAYVEERGESLETLRWQPLGLCHGLDTENFYSKYESSEMQARTIDAMCERCPVRDICRTEGADGREWGTWGGVYYRDGKRDKRYNKHKEDDDTGTKD